MSTYTPTISRALNLAQRLLEYACTDSKVIDNKTIGQVWKETDKWELRQTPSSVTNPDDIEGYLSTIYEDGTKHYKFIWPVINLNFSFSKDPKGNRYGKIHSKHPDGSAKTLTLNSEKITLNTYKIVDQKPVEKETILWEKNLDAPYTPNLEEVFDVICEISQNKNVKENLRKISLWRFKLDTTFDIHGGLYHERLLDYSKVDIIYAFTTPMPNGDYAIFYIKGEEDNCGGYVSATLKINLNHELRYCLEREASTLTIQHQQELPVNFNDITVVEQIFYAQILNNTIRVREHQNPQLKKI